MFTGTMNISPLFRTMYQTVGSIAPRIMPVKSLTSMINRNVHHMCNGQYLHHLSSICLNKASSMGLLQPSVPLYNLACGLKMKTVLHRRCKSCLLLWKNDRKYIICKKHPRHNQVERKKQPYKTWILTSVSQKPIREW